MSAKTRLLYRITPETVVVELMKLVDAYAEASRDELVAHEMDGPGAWARAIERRRRAREAVELELRRALGGA